jgi:hypothetical protein
VQGLQQQRQGKFDLRALKLSTDCFIRFFNTKLIEGVGTFQDAGTIENNPIGIALSEVKALFPLSEEPDFVVSLGTGGSSLDLDTSGPRNLILDGFIPRSFRAFWETMRGKRAWNTVTSSGSVRSSGKYHRLDIEFSGNEPRLDDTDSIPDMESKVLEDSTISQAIGNIARCAVASLFYFELDSIPKCFKGEYFSTGSILCKLRHGNPYFDAVLSQLSRNAATFLIDHREYPIFPGDISSFDLEGNFQKRIDLAVGDKFSIYLRESNSTPRNISGSPFSLEKVVLAQRLRAHFGRTDHRKRRILDEPDTVARKRRKLD